MILPFATLENHVWAWSAHPSRRRWLLAFFLVVLFLSLYSAYVSYATQKEWSMYRKKLFQVVSASPRITHQPPLLPTT